MDHDTKIVDRPDRGRFELADAPDQGYLEYRRSDATLTLVHTQVDDELEGRGIGSALVREALATGEEQGLTIVPQCPFVAGWLERHPEQAEELDIRQP